MDHPVEAMGFVEICGLRWVFFWQPLSVNVQKRSLSSRKMARASFGTAWDAAPDGHVHSWQQFYRVSGRLSGHLDPKSRSNPGAPDLNLHDFSFFLHASPFNFCTD